MLYKHVQNSAVLPILDSSEMPTEVISCGVFLLCVVVWCLFGFFFNQNSGWYSNFRLIEAYNFL